MSKPRIFFIGLTIGIILAAGASIPLTWYISKCDNDGGDIVITDPGETTPTEWLKPNPCPDCGKQIDIYGAVKQNEFFVTAQDDCKRNTRMFTLGIKPKVKHHVPFIGYSLMHDIDSKSFRHNLDANYYYSFGRVFLGGGLMFQFDKTRLYQAGPRVAFGVTW